MQTATGRGVLEFTRKSHVCREQQMFTAQWLKVNFVARSYSALATEDLGARLHHLNQRKDHQIVLLQRSEIFFELSKHVSAV